jgi:hypothetical protein
MSDLKLHMQLKLVNDISLDENEDEIRIYIIHFKWWAKIDENVVVFVTHDVVHGRHHMASYLIWIVIINSSCKYTCNEMWKNMNLQMKLQDLMV